MEAQPNSIGEIVLTGRILDPAQLDGLTQRLLEQFPGARFNLSGLRILRDGSQRIATVAVNVTHLQAQPGWFSEMVSQLLFGWQVEILDIQENWAFVRQMDGYLGWAYLPYLREPPAPFPTHLVGAPEALLRNKASARSGVAGRLLGGTAVHVMEIRGSWARIPAHQTGWVPLADLRGLDQLPLDEMQRRQMMMQDAAHMVGVPYLWGGIGANGIDCSGLSQLLHRWIGIPIPRDADLQFEAGKKVDPPFQPGDLLFYGDGEEPGQITHVSISTGGWKIIHSSRRLNGVYYDDVLADRYLREHFIGACRFV